MTKYNTIKEWVNKKYIVSYYLIIVAFFCSINYLTNNSLISAYVFLIPYISYAFIFLEGSIPRRLFSFSFLYVTMLLIDIFALLLIMNVFNVDIMEMLGHTQYRFMWAVFAKVTLVFVWKILLSMHFSANDEFPYKVFVTSSFSMSFISIMALIYIEKSEILNKIFLDISFSVVYFSLVSLALIIFMIYQSFLRMRKRYVKEVLEAYSRARKFRIELLKELQPLWALQYDKKVVNNSQISTAFERMQELYKENISTGNDFVDAVILLHESDAFENNTTLEVSGGLAVNNTIKTADICMMLEYLLSTAVKKVRSLDDDEAFKIINLSINDVNNELTLLLEIPSWKDDVSFDLKPIEDIVKRYKGKAESVIADYYRTTTVNIPYPDVLSV